MYYPKTKKFLGSDRKNFCIYPKVVKCVTLKYKTLDTKFRGNGYLSIERRLKADLTENKIGKLVEEMLEKLEKALLWEILDTYPDIRYYDTTDLVRVLLDVYENIKIPLIFVIDEWDCIFREGKEDKEGQKIYLDFLRNLLKDKTYVGVAYMTGILPVKKYGTHSALNMFEEFSMTRSEQMAEYMGFTEEEVKKLCVTHQRDFDEMKKWYDGYRLEKLHVYSPKSVVSAIEKGKFRSYWVSTETYEALKVYIDMNMDGLKDSIIEMLGGGRCNIDPQTFQNDMTTFRNKEDVISLLVHLGYLAYDEEKEEAFIPNMEIQAEFVRAMQDEKWSVDRAYQRLCWKNFAGGN